MPLVEEDEFSFAVVDGRFSVQFGDVGQLTDALRSLHPNTQQQLTETLRRPPADIALRPAGGSRGHTHTHTHIKCSPALSSDTTTSSGSLKISQHVLNQLEDHVTHTHTHSEMKILTHRTITDINSKSGTDQCQLLTLVASARSSTIHRGSPSPHLAMRDQQPQRALTLKCAATVAVVVFCQLLLFPSCCSCCSYSACSPMKC